MHHVPSVLLLPQGGLLLATSAHLGYRGVPAVTFLLLEAQQNEE